LSGGSFFHQADTFQLTTVLGADVLLIARLVGREAISEPFEFKLTMHSTKGDILASKILRSKATVSIEVGDSGTRYFNGVFRDFVQGGYDVASRLYTYEGTLVPSLWFLSLGWNCKIFQNMSVPDIVQKVLNDNGVTDFKVSTTGEFSEREYCVQYRESNLNFVSRLLEEEGISYYFVHADGSHTMMIVDTTLSAPKCLENQVQYSSTSEEGNIAASCVWSIFLRDQVYTPKVTLTDYDFESPSMSLLTVTTSKAGGSEEKFDYPGKYDTQNDGAHYGDARMKELETFATSVRGESNCVSFTSGLQFTLSDHYRSDTNAAYLITSVEHMLAVPRYVAGDAGDFVFQNRFEAIPLTVPFCPLRRARKPVLAGSQTAVVVGASGSEIYCDKYGRVKVQFFWDRVGDKDEKSSCWVRVSQIWAGKQWGWMTIPRVGQEVVVDFLEGDPDRPLIVGRVYNGDQMPPYALPDNSTQSGIKTRSSSGGGSSNYNEIRFEDKMGSEVITVHAEKDMTTEVENDDTQTVDHDRTITVKGKHTETITGDTAITIQQGNHSTTLDQGNQSTKVSIGSASHEAMEQISLKVGQSSIVLTQDGITIKALTISIEGTAELQAKAPMTSVKADGILQLQGSLTTIN
jgi:type VI secretion system secreted protein VgrG